MRCCLKNVCGLSALMSMPTEHEKLPFWIVRVCELNNQSVKYIYRNRFEHISRLTQTKNEFTGNSRKSFVKTHCHCFKMKKRKTTTGFFWFLFFVFSFFWLPSFVISRAPLQYLFKCLLNNNMFIFSVSMAS